MNGGYHNLHKLHSQVGDVAPDTGAVLKYGVDAAWGFMTLAVGKDTISGTTTEIDKSGNARQGDTFSTRLAP